LNGRVLLKATLKLATRETLVFEVGGSLLAMLMGERFGPGRPFAVACLTLLISLYLLADIGSLFEYGLAA